MLFRLIRLGQWMKTNQCDERSANVIKVHQFDENLSML